MNPAAPTIFSNQRREACRRRLLAASEQPPFLIAEMIEDVLDRLAFVRCEPANALVAGDPGGTLAEHLTAGGAAVTRADIVGDSGALALDLEQPWPVSGFALIVVLGLLDTVNDLPGALIHLRGALAPGGRVIASFPGAGSLPALRAAINAAEPDRPAARMHPLVDTRAAAGLLQRAGWSDPVVDSHELRASYRSLGRLVADVREHGFGNSLARPGPPLGKPAFGRASAAFMAQAGEDGRVVETFAILTLSGRRSLAGT